MCGIVGMYSKNNVSHRLLESMLKLQHRGQDASGIYTVDSQHNIYYRKKNGLILNRYEEQHLERLPGNIGIGHVRYQTSGIRKSLSKSEIQPFYNNIPQMIFAHNGHVKIPDNISQFLRDNNILTENSDSQLLMNYIALLLRNHNIIDVIKIVQENIVGSYSIVLYVFGVGMIAFKDPWGIRPLCYGYNSDEFIVASEDVVTGGHLTEIDPGEIICFDGNKFRKIQGHYNNSPKPCIFEFVYLARPDSTIWNVLVYEARCEMGKFLARQIKKSINPSEIDIVVPVPETSRPAAMQIATILGVEYVEAIIKNPFSTRTFISGQDVREKSLKRKFNVIKKLVQNKRILIVDDSIVRGNVSKYLVSMVRDAGAENVYMASCAPPIRYPNIYGIDIGAVSQLIAHEKSIPEITAEIGVDKLFYMELPDLISAVRKLNPKLTSFETSIFDGIYL